MAYVGGYNPDGTPGPLLSRALNYVNTQVGRFESRIAHDGLAASTTIILSAKHGQSPEKLSTLRRVDDGPIIDGDRCRLGRAAPGRRSRWSCSRSTTTGC